MQELALGAGVEQEGVAAEGEGPIQTKLVLRLIMRLPPCHIVVLHIKLLTADQTTTLAPESGTGMGNRQNTCNPV